MTQEYSLLDLYIMTEVTPKSSGRQYPHIKERFHKSITEEHVCQSHSVTLEFEFWIKPLGEFELELLS